MAAAVVRLHRRIFFGGGEVVEISLSSLLLLGQIVEDNVLDRIILLLLDDQLGDLPLHPAVELGLDLHDGAGGQLVLLVETLNASDTVLNDLDKLNEGFVIDW